LDQTITWSVQNDEDVEQQSISIPSRGPCGHRRRMCRTTVTFQLG